MGSEAMVGAAEDNRLPLLLPDSKPSVKWGAEGGLPERVCSGSIAEGLEKPALGSSVGL